MPVRHPPAIILLGPTASGKTAVSASLAQSLSCEIVSVDSAQVYKGMDIGTAKPESEFRERTPHHGIDIIEPHESYSAARFRDDALASMREISERGNIPLLVGGTMLYYKSLIEGLNDLPEADPMVRLMIDTLAQEKGWPGVHGHLMKVDPETAARLDPNDAQRIQRAMEVFQITGKPMSVLLKKPKYVYFPYTPITISLTPSDRSVLHERIGERFLVMHKAGLLTEVKQLVDEYGLDAEMPSMRCVGYRQALQHLTGTINEAQFIEHSISATRQFAKRQLTWLRGMDNLTEFDCLEPDLDARVLDYIRQTLEAHYLSDETDGSEVSSG